MLVEFRVENYRSLFTEQVLSFARVGKKANADDRLRAVQGTPYQILPVAAIYGANASGKSNLLGAFAFAQEAVAFSHRLWAPDEGVPQDPFAWGDTLSRPTTLEFEIVLNGVRFQYGFVCDKERFAEEWLYAWPQGRKQRWFERDGDSFKFGEHLRGENRVVEEVTRANALFLSTAAQHRHEQLHPIYAWFRQLQMVNVTRGVRSSMALRGRTRDLRWMFPDLLGIPFEGIDDLRQRQALLRELLKAADLGITDVELRHEEGDGRERVRVYLEHQTASRGPGSWLPLEEESAGTKTLFRLAPGLIQALDSGGMLIVDELETSLHPLLALQLVRLFNSPKSNPNNAQLLFSTHDTNLLGSIVGAPPLRRDQIWFTEKDEVGATHLYPLTDYQPRKGENLERGYLQGRYGAIPFLGELRTVVD